MNSLIDYKKGLCSLRLEGMGKVYNSKGQEDKTLVRATFSILDFSASGNKQIIPKKIGLECMHTLKYKPLVCKYIEATDYDNLNDRFVEHEEKNITLRNGEEYLSSGTTPIGVCENVYLGIVENDDGEEIDVIMGDFLLWLYRFPNEISLINEFHENNETLYSSCEYYYKSSSKDENDNEIIDEFILDGHCVLGSDEYGNKIEPAYHSSKLVAFNEHWEKAVNNMKNKLQLNQKEEIKNMDKNNVLFEHLKSINAISAGSIRWRILNALEKVMMAEEYNNMWLSDYDIFQTENYFLYETWVEDAYKLYKVTFSVNENDEVTVNYEGKQEMEHKYELVPVDNSEMEKSLNAKSVEVETLTAQLEDVKKSLNSKEKEITNITNDKESLNVKLNESNELVISLNSKVEDLTSKIEEMKPIVNKHEEAEFEKSLNNLKEFYKEKFENVGAIDVFEEESTQELIKKSVNAKTDDFKYQLNQLVVDSVKMTVKVDEETKPMAKSINSVIESKKSKNLIQDVADVYEDMCGIKTI